MIQRKKPAQRAFVGLAGQFNPDDVSLPKPPDPVIVDVNENAPQDKDADGDRRDVLAHIIKSLRRVHNLTPADVRTTFYPMNIERLRGLAKDYGIQLPPPIEVDEDLLEQFEQRQAKKEKDADRKRLARKSKSDQLMAIKEALKTPVREVIATAKQTELERQVNETREQKEMSMSRGRTMTDGGQQLVSGGYGSSKVESIAAALARATALGSPSFDSETGEPYWPAGDRRPVRPEGSSSDDAPERIRKRFVPKLDDADPTNNLLGISRDDWLSNIARRFFVKGGSAEDAPDTFFVCRLCHFECDWDTETKRHMEEVHGDEQLPSHDPRFGNVIEKQLKEIEAADRKRRASRHPESADALNS